MIGIASFIIDVSFLELVKSCGTAFYKLLMKRVNKVLRPQVISAVREHIELTFPEFYPSLNGLDVVYRMLDMRFGFYLQFGGKEPALRELG